MTLLASWESLREFSAMQDRMNRMNRLIRESSSPEVPEEALTTPPLHRLSTSTKTSTTLF